MASGGWTVLDIPRGVHFHSTGRIQSTNPNRPEPWGTRGQTPEVEPMHTRLLFASLAIALVGLAAVPNAAAQELPVDVAQTLCPAYRFDAQQDGNAETWTLCSTPQCGCYCPYVGAGVVVEAAGEQAGAVAIASCQTVVGYTLGPADGGAPVTVLPYVGGGGLDPIN